MSKIICYARKRRSPHKKVPLIIFSCWRGRLLKYWNSALKMLIVHWNIFMSSYGFKWWLTVQYQRRHQEKSAFITVIIYSYYLKHQSKRQSISRKHQIPTPQTLQSELLCYLLLKQPEKSFQFFMYNILRDLSLFSHSLWSQWKSTLQRWCM